MEPIDEASKTEVERYLSLDIEELYSLIPDYMPEHSGKMFSPDARKSVGKEVIQRLSAELKRAICQEWGYCKRRNDPHFNDSVRLTVAIGDVVTVACGLIPPFLISSLLIKLGLAKFCDCKTSESSKPILAED